MANFTDDQAKAIFTHDKNLVVVAGAGSGKSLVLVERYLTLLEQNRDWPLNALVAITFTREAALEMRNRVRLELERRLHQAQSPQDNQRWALLLAQMDSARIDTIHGLCVTILRANAAEAGVDPGFEVLEPIEAALLLNDVIDIELQVLVDDVSADTAALFSEYAMRDIRKVLSNTEILAAELVDMPLDSEMVFQAWQREWIDNYRGAVARLALDNRLAAAFAWEPAMGWPNDDKLMDVFRLVDDHWDAFLHSNVDVSRAALETVLLGTGCSTTIRLLLEQGTNL